MSFFDLPSRFTRCAALFLLLLCPLLGISTAPVSAESRPSGVPVAWGDNAAGLSDVPAGLSGVSMIAAGYGHTLALKNNGIVLGWGDNTYGQSAVPSGLSGVKAVGAGFAHSIALGFNGAVVGWGHNGDNRASPPGSLRARAIAVGGAHNLAIRTNGTVAAWGNNSDGQINVPAGLANVVAVAAGNYHSLALRADGAVVGWGLNTYGQASVPTGLSGVVAIAAGGSHSLALKDDGTVVAWGRNNNGQSTVPAGLAGVKAVAAGEAHSLALKDDGTVVAWGLNDKGQSAVPAGLTGIASIAAFGDHSLALKSRSVVTAWGSNPAGTMDLPSGLSGVVAVEGGDNHAVGLRSDGHVRSWGYNSDGRATVPAGLAHVKAVAAGVEHTLAVRSDGTVAAWGLNTYGQTNVPAGLAGVKAVAGGGRFSLALKSNGTVVAWGADNPNSGQDATDVPAGLSNVVAISAGEYDAVALRADGTLVGWGTYINDQTPPPTGLSEVIEVDLGRYFGLALRGDGTVIGWGGNGSGQSVPPPAARTGITAIDAGPVHGAALKFDGAVLAWGRNVDGQTATPAGVTGASGVATIYPNTLAFIEETAPPASSVVAKVGTYNPILNLFQPLGTYTSKTWTNRAVQITFSATDPAPGGGVDGIMIGAEGAATLEPDLFANGTGLIDPYEGIATLSYRGLDNAGNAEVERSFGIYIDKTAPAATVTAPAPGALYPVGGAVPAWYSCSDSLSGIASTGGCVGTVANGANIDTASPGTKSFAVTAKDHAGNAATKTVTYTVQNVNAAQVTAQTAPPSPASAGATYPVSVTVKNTGNTTWTRAGGYVLSSQNPLSNTNWGANLVYLPVGVSVSPGQSYTFSFNAKAPSAAGTYNFQWRMAQSGVGWFGDFSPNAAVNVVAHNAQFVSQTPPPATMTRGQTAVVSVTMKNTGTTTWSGTGFALTSQNPQGNLNWGTNLRYPPAGTTVAPGQSVTFTFVAKAPSTAGTYNFQWRMAKTGEAWFGAPSQNVSVTVN